MITERKKKQGKRRRVKTHLEDGIARIKQNRVYMLYVSILNGTHE